nr:hypothetical protein BaRGS_012175 [Batillaria attramentaria]
MVAVVVEHLAQDKLLKCRCLPVGKFKDQFQMLGVIKDCLFFTGPLSVFIGSESYNRVFYISIAFRFIFVIINNIIAF